VRNVGYYPAIVIKSNGFLISNANHYSGFHSLKNACHEKADSVKPRKIEGLRTCVPSSGVFACIGDGEAKNGDFGGKMMKFEKLRYVCGARRQH
jgi:hypothetical protein